MRFNIDCIFLSPENKVFKIIRDVPPFRILLPVKGANKVLEFPKNIADDVSINIGDILSFE